MTEQEENELICDRLLGWIGWKEPGEPLGWKNLRAHPGEILDTPTFSDWASAGLILDAMTRQAPTLVCYSANEWALVVPDNPGSTIMNTGPLAIRDAALEYIRDAPQANAGETGEGR